MKEYNFIIKVTVKNSAADITMNVQNGGPIEHKWTTPRNKVVKDVQRVLSQYFSPRGAVRKSR